VLNDEDEYARALKYGASGIMTDFPSRLSQYLNHHHNHNERRTMLWCRLRCLCLCVIYGVVLLGNFVLLDVVVCWLLQLLLVMHCVLWQILQLSSILALLHVCVCACVCMCVHTHTRTRTHIVAISAGEHESTETAQVTPLRTTLASSPYSECSSCCQQGHTGSKTLLQ